MSDSHPVLVAEITNTLKQVTKKPLAVLLIGGNDERKEQVAAEIVGEIGGANYEVVCSASIPRLTPAIFYDRQTALIDLINGTSSSYSFRSRVIQQLRASSAETIAAVWVKSSPHDNHNSASVNKALDDAPPTAEGIEYLFEVEP